MEKKDMYRIGEIADLLGLSRDTLRYYEKRGLLSSQKAHNGYRYYTKQDIYHLVSIMYQRKMNIPLSDMESLWGNTSTLSSLPAIIENRLSEEYQAIREHQRTIARLKLARQDCLQIEKNLDKVEEKAFPAAYVIVLQADMLESTDLWFEYSRKYPGLDMLYEFDQYLCSSDAENINLEYRNTQLLLHQWLAEYVDYPAAKEAPAMSVPRKCLSTICASATRTPDDNIVGKLISRARADGLKLTGQLFSTYCMQGLRHGRQVFYLELFMPVTSY